MKSSKFGYLFIKRRFDDHDSKFNFTSIAASYTPAVIEKSNLLLRANLLEAQQQFDEAAELFARVARIESQLAATAQQHGQADTALVHLVSEMSCWAAAGDTYRALSRGQQLY